MTQDAGPGRLTGMPPGRLELQGLEEYLVGPLLVGRLRGGESAQAVLAAGRATGLAIAGHLRRPGLAGAPL